MPSSAQACASESEAVTTADSCMAKGSVSSGDNVWASAFEQLAVQVLDSEVTALHAMHPTRVGGLALFAVAGTADGVLHFLDAQGNAVARHDTGVCSMPNTSVESTQ